MTYRTKRVINVMQKKSSKMKKQLEEFDTEYKRRNEEFKSDTCRRSDDRIDEIKKRAG
jgi:hypothetical protein